MTLDLKRNRIAIFGPPAAGKSALVDQLGRVLNSGAPKHINLDDDVIRLCAERHLTGSLADEVIDEAVGSFTRRYRDCNCAMVEFPYHDYIKLVQQGVLRLDDFDVVLVVTAPLEDLIARNRERQIQVPEPYIARCLGAAAAISEHLKRCSIPWMRLDSNLMRPGDMADLVVSYLRRSVSKSLALLDVVPLSESPYIGGHFRSEVEWSHVLADRIVERFEVQNALDVGCGAGLTLDRFANLGITCWGVEGNPRVLDGPCQRKERLFIVDFHKQWVKLPVEFDLVWCVEVLEHIPPAHEENLVLTIVKNARRVVFVSAAQPGQIGYFHVNCRPRNYWIGRFENAGLRYLHETEKLLSDLDEGGPFGKTFIRENGMFFEVFA